MIQSKLSLKGCHVIGQGTKAEEKMVGVTQRKEGTHRAAKRVNRKSFI